MQNGEKERLRSIQGNALSPQPMAWKVEARGLAAFFGSLLRGFCGAWQEFGGILRFFALRKWLISRVIPRYSTKFHSAERIFFNHGWTRIGGK
jgi:hypothetical protein